MARGIPPGEAVELVVSQEHAGWRLDWFLAEQLRGHSRVKLRELINANGVTVDGHRTKASHRLVPGQRVVVVRMPELARAIHAAEEIPLSILYEDDWMVAVDKPPGMVVHPARGHWKGTLTAALQWHFDTLSQVGGPSRPGVVHRLDRDTSGVIVVAKHDQAHHALAQQWQDRTVEKEYFALVSGRPDRDRDYVDEPIGFHPRQREKMAIRRDDPRSRPARSFYEVTERFSGYAAVRIVPETGRTHQIRVHLAHLGCPVLCDAQYGGRPQLTRGEVRGDPNDETVLLARQALHAARLRLNHPKTGQPLELVAPLPADLAGTLAEIRAFRPLSKPSPR